MLKIDSVSKQYAQKLALDNVSFEVPEKSIFGLLGPNGAGKTSLLRIITGITGADSGQVYLDGKKMDSKLIANIGYLPEERGLYKKMPIYEQALYFAQLKGLGKKEAVQAIDFWFGKFDIDSWRTKKVEDLSKGMQQKVQFIITVLHNPKLIILDEPFTGFDPVNAELVRNEIIALREQGATVILSTHRMESVEQMCDNIALIHNSKKVLAGSLASIKNNYKKNTFETITDVFDAHVVQGVDLQLQEKTFDGKQKNIFSSTEAIVPNELIKQLLPHTQIYSFTEVLPSINDIFISIVKNQDTEE